MKRWQFFLIALAILASSLACQLIPTQTPAGETTPSPVPSKTQIPAPAAPKIQKTQTPAEILETVSAMRALNVRQGPSEKTESIGILYHGAEISLTGSCRSGWAEILHVLDGETVHAWVNSRYITGETCKEE